MYRTEMNFLYSQILNVQNIRHYLNVNNGRYYIEIKWKNGMISSNFMIKPENSCKYFYNLIGSLIN